MDNDAKKREIKMRLVEAGGRISQDLGAGRMVGMILVYLYLQEQECSLDSIGEELELSKASISIAARQLEQLGLVRRIWRKGEKKKYYRSADNIAQAIQKGIFTVVQNKVKLFGDELECSAIILNETGSDNDPEFDFLRQRVGRAKSLQKKLHLFLNNPLIKVLSRSRNE
ncbi:MAG: hypothetical protein HGB26_02030 [Desulfobulbaceae bacterium]|nr:hypothetical protein [Desulfobulbaceae bacterium]